MSEADVTTLKNATEALNKTVQEFSTKMYQAAQQAGIDPNNMGGGAAGGSDDEIIDG